MEIQRIREPEEKRDNRSFEANDLWTFVSALIGKGSRNDRRNFGWQYFTTRSNTRLILLPLTLAERSKGDEKKNDPELAELPLLSIEYPCKLCIYTSFPLFWS